MFFAAEDVELIATVVARAAAAAGSQPYVRSNPMAYLAPFGIISRRGVGVGEGDC
jgi:hypothetical protein